MSDCAQSCLVNWQDVSSAPGTADLSDGLVHHFTFAIPAGTYIDAFCTINVTTAAGCLLLGGFTPVLGGNSAIVGYSSAGTFKNEILVSSSALLSQVQAHAGGTVDFYIKQGPGFGAPANPFINCFVLHLQTFVDEEVSIGTTHCGTVPAGHIFFSLAGGGGLPFPAQYDWAIFSSTGGLPAHSLVPEGWNVPSAIDFCSIDVCTPCFPNLPGMTPTAGQKLGAYRAWKNLGFNPVRNGYDYIRSELFDLVYDVGCNDTGAPAPGTGTIVSNPYMLEDKGGNYHATGLDAATEGSSIYYRSDFAVPAPAWAVTSVVLPFSSLSSDPRVERDFRGLLYAVGTKHVTANSSFHVLLSRSDDDGATWNTATTVLPSCKHGTIVKGHDGSLLIAGWNTTSSAIMARYQSTGDTALGTAYTFKDSSGSAFFAIDDTFQIAQEWELPGRYILHYPSGTGTSTLRRSGDDCQTWETAITTMSGKHPTVAHFSGVTFAAVYTGGGLSIKRQESGDIAFSSVYNAIGPATATAVGAVTANLALADTTFHFMTGFELPGRLVMHALETGQSKTTHLFSGDEGSSWTRLT